MLALLTAEQNLAFSVALALVTLLAVLEGVVKGESERKIAMVQLRAEGLVIGQPGRGVFIA